MPISLRTNAPSLEISSKLNKTSDALSRTYERLSTGSRIVRPGDDPAGAQIADALKADARVASVAIQNANTALSFTSIADSALAGISDLLMRMSELAQQSANGVYANSQRSALSSEFLALGSEIERIASTTEFNGLTLLSNSSAVTIQVGIDGGSNSQIRLNALQGTLTSLGLAGTGSSQMSYSIISSSETESLSASRNAVTALGNALTSLTSTRGSIGATESRLQAAISNVVAQREQFVSAESRIRDADVAQEVAELVRLQVLQQAQAAVLGQANQQVGVALQLLG
jgi:flagellin